MSLVTPPAHHQLESRRLADLHDFALDQLPVAPARVLEVGCGDGRLARALAAAGHDVTAVDPRAPEGAIFRRFAFEKFSDPDGFEAVVASVSLHHIDDLAAALEKIAGLIRPGGIFILEEFACERLSGPTARWYYHQRQAVAAASPEPQPLLDTFELWHDTWVREHAHIHSCAAMRPQLDRFFVQRSFAWRPYLHSYALDDLLEPLERKLIAAGTIEATGFRYVGEPAQ